MATKDKFEHTKMQLYNATQMKEVKNNPILRATILSIIKNIPVIGELIDNTMEIALTKFQETKRQELLDIILSDSENITSDMINDDFIINFIRTVEAVNRLASNDKVVYFANVIKNGYLSDDKITNDEFEEYLFALSTMSYRQINVLIDLYIHEKNNVAEYIVKDGEKENKLANRHKCWNLFIDNETSKYSITEEDVVSILSSISRTGFCNEITGAYFGYTGGVFYVTNSCKRFVEKITGEINE